MLALVLAVLVLSKLYLGSLANIGCLFQGQYVPIDRTQLRGSGSLYLLPLDGFPVDTLEGLANRYREKYGLSIRIAPNLSTPPAVFDNSRRQFVCERVVDFVRTEFHPQEKHPVVLAFSTRDMYVAGRSGRYAFGCWNPGAGVGVLSSARMMDGTSQESRLRKMTTRYIGILYYRLPFSNQCGSVMFSSVGGPQELDLMGEDF